MKNCKCGGEAIVEHGFIDELNSSGKFVCCLECPKQTKVYLDHEESQALNDWQNDKLAQSAGGCKSSDLPADQGREAFRNRVDKNPYKESEWEYKEWGFGWDSEEQSNPNLYDHKNEKFY